MMQRMWKFIPLAATLLLLALPAEARIKRSCDARMFIILKGHDGYSPGERTLERFSATASCPWGQGNRCRRRARDKALTCMLKSWDNRWDRKTPDDCKSNKGINHYSMPNIKCDLYDRICSEVREMGHPVHLGGTAIVKGQTSGRTDSCRVSERTYGEYSVSDCIRYIGGETVEAEHCGY